MMHGRTELQEERRRGADEERRAILGIIERYIRQLAHGHGATGPGVLQQLVDEIERRGEARPR